MNEDLQCLVLHEYFPSEYNYHVEKMDIDPTDYGSFECTFRIKGSGLELAKLCEQWLKDFSELTKTRWRVVLQKNVALRFQFSQDLVCNYGGCKIMDGIYGDRCAAYMKIRIKNCTHGVRTTDVLAARGFFIIISLDFAHNHLLLDTGCFFSIVYRPRHEITLMLINYFWRGIDSHYKFICKNNDEILISGVSPQAAKIWHEKYIMENQKQGEQDCLIDAVLNPSLVSIQQSLKCWRAMERGRRKFDKKFCR